MHVVLDGFIRDPVRVDSCADPDGSITTLGRLVDYLDRGGTSIFGHFVLCVIDPARGVTSVFRDRLGGRVAYFRHHDEAVEVSGAAHLVAPRNWQGDPVYLARHFALAGQDVPGRTAFGEVNELLPGERMRIDASGLRRSRDPLAFEDAPTRGTATDWPGEFRRRFQQAVCAAVDGHRHVAVMLSGGLDSVPILAAACQEARNTSSRVTPVSWSLPAFPECDETRWIRMAADSLGVDPILYDGDGLLPFSDLGPDVVSPDSPAFNAFRPLILGCYRRAAEAGCTVILNGNQGDGLYAPRALGLFDAVRRSDFTGLARELAWTARERGVAGLFRDPAIRYPVSRMVRRRQRRKCAPEWMTPDAVEWLKADGRWPPEANAHPYPAYAAQLLGSLMTFGPAQENEFARRFGLDRREPFQDEALARLLLSAPVSWSVHCGQTKRIMRSAMHGEIPDALRLKNRSGVLTTFMRAGWRQNRQKIKEILLDETGGWSPFVDSAYLHNALDTDEPEERQIMVACQCLGAVKWLERVKSI